MSTPAIPKPPRTPADPVPPKKKHPGRGTRKRVLGDGEGDYCIYQIVGAGTDIPQGALLPIPNVPTFEHSLAAMQWIRQQSGDLLTGKQVAVIAFKEIMDIQVVTKPTVKIVAKTKTVVTKTVVPKAETKAAAK